MTFLIKYYLLKIFGIKLSDYSELKYDTNEVWIDQPAILIKKEIFYEII